MNPEREINVLLSDEGNNFSRVQSGRTGVYLRSLSDTEDFLLLRLSSWSPSFPPPVRTGLRKDVPQSGRKLNMTTECNVK